MKIILSEKEHIIIDMPEEITIATLQGIIDRLQRISKFMAKDPNNELAGTRQRYSWNYILDDPEKSKKIIAVYDINGTKGVRNYLNMQDIPSAQIYYLLGKIKAQKHGKK